MSHEFRDRVDVSKWQFLGRPHPPVGWRGSGIAAPVGVSFWACSQHPTQRPPALAAQAASAGEGPTLTPPKAACWIKSPPQSGLRGGEPQERVPGPPGAATAAASTFLFNAHPAVEGRGHR